MKYPSKTDNGDHWLRLNILKLKSMCKGLDKDKLRQGLWNLKIFSIDSIYGMKKH